MLKKSLLVFDFGRKWFFAGYSVIKFSTYPEYLAERKFDQEIRCQIYYKYLVANPVKRKFTAFYSRYKVFRLFSYEGILEKEIQVWDWDGNPIIVYSLDRDYHRFTVSEKHKKIYLTSIEESDLDKIFVFDMLHVEN